MSGAWRVGVALLGLVVGGCGSSGPSMPDSSAPTISNLTVPTGTDRALILRMSATDPQSDILGGRCVLSSLQFTANPVMAVTTATPPNPAAPLTVTCTMIAPPGFTGRPFIGTIAVADVMGNVSNPLSFSTTLPERPRPSS